MLLTQPDASVSAPRESNVSAAAVADGEDALTSRLLQSTIHAFELYSIYLGKELGLYAALQSGESVTPPELARRAGIAPRYAREWLEQQAVAGFLEVDAPPAPADTRATGSRPSTSMCSSPKTIRLTSRRWRRWWRVSVGRSNACSRPIAAAAACRIPCSARHFGRARRASIARRSRAISSSAGFRRPPTSTRA